MVRQHQPIVKIMTKDKLTKLDELGKKIQALELICKQDAAAPFDQFLIAGGGYIYFGYYNNRHRLMFGLRPLSEQPAAVRLAVMAACDEVFSAYFDNQVKRI